MSRAEELMAAEAAGREDSFDRNLRAALALSLGQEPPPDAGLRAILWYPIYMLGWPLAHD